MIYFQKQNDGRITKWDISYDKKALMKIKEEVIENFSEIIHYEKYRSIVSLHIELSLINYKNLKKEPTDKKDIYFVSYDEIKYPMLVSLIDRLISGDVSVIPMIESPIETSQNFYDSQIERLDKEIDLIDNYDTDLKINKLKELRKVIIDSELNKKEKDITKYYEMVESAITKKHIDNLSSEEVERIEKFFNTSCGEIIKIKSK